MVLKSAAALRLQAEKSVIVLSRPPAEACLSANAEPSKRRSQGSNVAEIQRQRAIPQNCDSCLQDVNSDLSNPRPGVPGMHEQQRAQSSSAAPANSAEPSSSPAKAAEAVDHLKASLDKLRHNVSTYVLFCFLLAWCLTGTSDTCQNLGQGEVNPNFIYRDGAVRLASMLCGSYKAASCAGTSHNLFFNLPLAAIALGLLYWLLQQQEVKIKQALGSRSEHRRAGSGTGPREHTGSLQHSILRALELQHQRLREALHIAVCLSRLPLTMRMLWQCPCMHRLPVRSGRRQTAVQEIGGRTVLGPP